MISDEAVEAALRGIPLRTAQFIGRIEMRAALEAAAPYIAAQAWDEGEHVGYQNCGFDDLGLPTTPNPYRSQA